MIHKRNCVLKMNRIYFLFYFDNLSTIVPAVRRHNISFSYQFFWCLENRVGEPCKQRTACIWLFSATFHGFIVHSKVTIMVVAFQPVHFGQLLVYLSREFIHVHPTIFVLNIFPIFIWFKNVYIISSCFKTAASESNENWEKYSTQRW